MRNHIAPCVFLVLLGACATSRQSGPELTLEVGGHTRRYLVHAPPGLESGGPHPAVLVLHGGGGAGGIEDLGRYTGMDAKADASGFIAVYPAALYDNWNDGRNADILREQKEGIDDVAFFRALLDRLVADHHVDPRRIYATGISNGGFMSHRLGCELSDRIVAIAPVAAGMAQPLSLTCAPARGVPVLNFHGTHDGFVPFEGGNVTAPYTRQNRGPTLSSDGTRDVWARANGCGSGVTRSNVTPDARDGTTVEKVTVDGCPAAAPVIQMVIHGGGHTWPGARWVPYLGPVTKDINAADAIWEFFRDRRLP